MTPWIRPSEIILAEDNAADVVLVREALKEHHVDCVLHVIRDGAEAITFIENLDADPKAPPLDLLLLDMHLPKREGQDVLRRLRTSRRYAQTPVLIMTSLESTLIADNVLRHAALSYFRKPSTLDEFMQLGAIVQRLLGVNTELTWRPTNAADTQGAGGEA